MGRPGRQNMRMTQIVMARRAAVCVALVVLGGPVRADSLARDWALCRQDDGGGQIRACTAVIRASRHDTDALARAFFNRGRAWVARGDIQRAIQDLTQAIHFDPDHADAYNDRGTAFAAQGQYDRAIEDFAQAIRLDPGFAIAIYNRGLAYQAQGRAAEAERDFEQARRTGPRLTEPKE